MNALFADLSPPAVEAGVTSLLLTDTPGFAPVAFTSSVAPIQTPAPVTGVLAARAPEQDAFEMMRKLFVGGQVDDMKARVEAFELQTEKRIEDFAKANASLTQKIEHLERTLRGEIANAASKAQKELEERGREITDDVERERVSLVTSVDDRFRKLSASSVPRTHLAEILRDLSSRLNPTNI